MNSDPEDTAVDHQAPAGAELGNGKAVAAIAAVALVLAIAAAWWWLGRAPALERALGAAAAAIQDQLPLALTPQITLAAVRVEQQALVFDNISTDPEAALDTAQVATAACDNPTTGRILELGGQVRYRLASSAGQELSSVSVSTEDCAPD